MDNRFINYNEFRRDALRFDKEESYCDAPIGTKSYNDYWEEQVDRCLNGYRVGNLEITGYMYYYLNFTQIKRNVTDDRGRHYKEMNFPRFYDWDYNFFWAVEIARHGVTKEKYKNLQLDVDIDDISGGNHLVVIKGRRKGYTYKSGSMLARNFNLKRNTKGYAMASEKEYLNKNGILDKAAFPALTFAKKHTPFGQPLLTDTKLHKESGYKEKTNDGYVEKGTKNEIIGISLKDNPEKARGKDGELGFFEEAGKFPGLLKAWEVCKPSYEQGDYTTGLMVAYGTGGTEGGDYEGLEELFYSPESYDVLPIKNVWDEGAEHKNCGFFVPAYKHLEGHIDEYGNSNDLSAKSKLQENREKKKEADSPKAHTQYIAEFPFTPREATLRSDNNIFPTSALNAHLSEIESKDLTDILTAGRIYRGSDGQVTFKPDSDVHPIFKYPTKKGIDRSGGVVIKETPYRNEEGQIPNNMYLACHDPYAHDGSPDGSSLGATYIIKRTNNLDLSYSNCIVASYVGRPQTQEEYNRNLFLLLEYYNAKLAFENDRGNIMEYAKNKKKLEYLLEKPDIIENKTRRKRSLTTRNYGISMSSKSLKNQCEVYIRDWLLEQYGKNPEGKTKRILHTILDPALIQELTKYNNDGNFDRVSALMVGMVYLKQLEKSKVVAKNRSMANSDFFNRQLFQ